MEHEIIKIKDKNVFICEKHHHVLAFWNQFKDKQPHLLTFDHHTDLHVAFQRLLNTRYPITFSFEGRQEKWNLDQKSLLQLISENDQETILKLTHDEHIDAAVQAGVIKKALSYTYDSYTNRPNRVYRINGDGNYNNEPIINNPILYQDVQSPIESTELEEGFNRFDFCLSRDEWMQNYILDIDLDFFHTRKSIHPLDISFFKNLVDNAIAISIAKESNFIESWKTTYDDTLSVDYLLENLLELIRN